MKNDRNMIEKVERLFIASHRKQPAVAAGPGWRARVMNQIHELESIRDGALSRIGVEKNAWRFAAAAGLAALVMIVYVMNGGLVPEYEILRVLMDYPDEFAVSQSFGF